MPEMVLLDIYPMSGALKSNRTPTLFRSVDDGWDPYSLTNRTDIIKALLDTPTVEDIQLQVEEIFRDVPQSGDWEAATKRKQLAPKDLGQIIRIAIGDTWEREPQPSPSHPSMESMISRYHEHAGSLRRKKGIYGHAERIATFIEHSLMRIQEFMDGSSREASMRVGTIYQKLHYIKADADRRTTLWRRLRAGASTGRNGHERSLRFVTKCLQRLPGARGK